MIEPAAAPHLRGRAEALAAPLPPLLAEAERLARAVMLGAHGRRRAGMGDEFWQYRPAHAGDDARVIDWRRSARSDAHFVREKEWQAAQTVALWVDPGRSMAFAGDAARPTKADRARLLALALAVLLIRGGERVGLADGRINPRPGLGQAARLAEVLAADVIEAPDYAVPATTALPPQGRAVFLSDFLGDPAGVEAAVLRAAGQGTGGVLLQILDPQEEAFPFDGRTIFESMSGALRHETLRAGDLRTRYLQRLAERKAFLNELARATGWQVFCHHTDGPASAALLWLYQALERRR